MKWSIAEAFPEKWPFILCVDTTEKKERSITEETDYSWVGKLNRISLIEDNFQESIIQIGFN